MVLARKRFQGVVQILSFNRHFYALGLAALAMVLLSHTAFGWSGASFCLVLAALLYGLIMPLIVSAYVYDFSGYYDFHWLKKSTADPDAKNILNINAGFDETSFIIRNVFPQSDLTVFDFYDPERHTEPAIVRARRLNLRYPGTLPIKTNSIPLNDQSADLIFLLSAAHEIRDCEERIVFLKECCRVCAPKGKVIMVEHLRDSPNFLAFSVGFTHFFSKPNWKNAFTKAGFGTFEEHKFTPFLSVFTIEPGTSN